MSAYIQKREMALIDSTSTRAAPGGFVYFRGDNGVQAEYFISEPVILTQNY